MAWFGNVEVCTHPEEVPDTFGYLLNEPQYEREKVHGGQSAQFMTYQNHLSSQVTRVSNILHSPPLRVHHHLSLALTDHHHSVARAHFWPSSSKHCK